MLDKFDSEFTFERAHPYRRALCGWPGGDVGAPSVLPAFQAHHSPTSAAPPRSICQPSVSVIIRSSAEHRHLSTSPIFRRRRLASVMFLEGLCSGHGWLGSRVVSVLDSGAEGPGFKSQPGRCRVITVLGKLFTPIVPLFTKKQNW